MAHPMAHPRMYRETDPYLRDVRRVCLALPETAEVESWGRPTFRAGKKMFAVYGCHGERPVALIVKPEPGEVDALLADDRFFAPPYFGPAGWVALDLPNAPIDWSEICELVETSYRQVALVRMIKALDGATSARA